MSDHLAVARAHLAAVDPVLARLIATIDAPRSRHYPSLFAALASAIISQQISVKAAASIRGRLLDLLASTGDTLSAAGILRQPTEALRAVGLSQAKTRSLQDLAQRVARGELDLDRLPARRDEEVIDELTKVSGIGRWTAEMVLIFALERPDVLPVDDLGIRTAVQRQYGLDQLPTAPVLRAIAEPWRPYRSLACRYLWRSLDNEPLRATPAIAEPLARPPRPAG